MFQYDQNPNTRVKCYASHSVLGAALEQEVEFSNLLAILVILLVIYRSGQLVSVIYLSNRSFLDFQYHLGLLEFGFL